MKLTKHQSILLVFLPVFWLWGPHTVFSESSKAEIQQANTETMVIKSDALEIDNKKKMVTFTGNVDARRDKFIINGEKMVLYYNNPETAKKEGVQSVKVDKIIATGKVQITRKDGGIAMAEKAVYYQSEEKVILTGHPVVKHGDDFIEGARITLFLKEDRSIVEGSENQKVKAVLYPGSVKR